MSDFSFPTGQTTIDWLRYATYVDEARRILYVETPKCGCSSIKYMLRGAAPLHFSPSMQESRLDMMVHDRLQMPQPPLTNFTPERQEEIAREPGWFRFTVLRNPIARFFSAWRDKIFLCEPGFGKYIPRDGKRFVEFADFYRRVMAEDDPDLCDPHWRSQTALTLPDHIDYTRIYDISELSDLPGDLAEHLAAIGAPAALPEFQRLNESFSVKPDGFVTPEILAGLREFYRIDFLRFDFPEMALSWAEPRRAADLVDHFTDAVFDRNRTIAAYSAWARQILPPR